MKVVLLSSFLGEAGGAGAHMVKGVEKPQTDEGSSFLRGYAMCGQECIGRRAGWLADWLRYKASKGQKSKVRLSSFPDFRLCIRFLSGMD